MQSTSRDKSREAKLFTFLKVGVAVGIAAVLLRRVSGMRSARRDRADSVARQVSDSSPAPRTRREKKKDYFGKVAKSYEQFRPKYPAALQQQLLSDYKALEMKERKFCCLLFPVSPASP